MIRFDLFAGMAIWAFSLSSSAIAQDTSQEAERGYREGYISAVTICHRYANVGECDREPPTGEQMRQFLDTLLQQVPSHADPHFIEGIRSAFASGCSRGYLAGIQQCIRSYNRH